MKTNTFVIFLLPNKRGHVIKFWSGSLLLILYRWSWLCLYFLLPVLNVDVIIPGATAVTRKLWRQKALRQASGNTENSNRGVRRELRPQIALVILALMQWVYSQASGHTEHVFTPFWEPLLLGYGYFHCATSYSRNWQYLKDALLSSQVLGVEVQSTAEWAVAVTIPGTSTEGNEMSQNQSRWPGESFSKVASSFLYLWLRTPGFPHTQSYYGLSYQNSHLMKSGRYCMVYFDLDICQGHVFFYSILLCSQSTYQIQ